MKTIEFFSYKISFLFLLPNGMKRIAIQPAFALEESHKQHHPEWYSNPQYCRGGSAYNRSAPQSLSNPCSPKLFINSLIFGSWPDYSMVNSRRVVQFNEKELNDKGQLSSF